MALGMAAYTVFQEDTENVVFVGRAGHLRLLSFKRLSLPPWTDTDLTATLGIPVPAPGSDVTAWEYPFGTANIAYVSLVPGQRDGVLTHLRRGPPYGERDWTVLTIANASPSPLASYIWAAENSMHIIFVSGGRVTEAYAAPGQNWRTNDIESAAGAPAPYNDPALPNVTSSTGYITTLPEIEHVIYTSSLGAGTYKIFELYHKLGDNGNSWGFTDVSAPPNQGGYDYNGTSIAGYFTLEDRTQHIVGYTNRTLNEIFRHASGNKWESNNLLDPGITERNPPPILMPPNDLFVFPLGLAATTFHEFNPNTTTEHVFYVGNDRNLWEIAKPIGPPPWRANNLTAHWRKVADGSPVVAYEWGEDRSLHVIYTDDAFIINELWRPDGGAWRVNEIGTL